jgi:hypothetical protein
MSLIFDNFPSKQVAEAFRNHVRKTYGQESQIFDSQAEANAHDPFPFKLVPPIVHVDRLEHDNSDVEINIETNIEKSVRIFGGQFAGT